jgi:hypothetical protein
MKKLYTLSFALLAMAATSIEANATAESIADLSNGLMQIGQKIEQITTPYKAPRLETEQGAASIDDVLGSYYAIHSRYNNSSESWSGYNMALSVSRGEVENEVVMTGFCFDGMTVTGTFNAENGTIHIAKQLVESSAEYDYYLETITADENSELAYSDEDIIFTYNAEDGSLASSNYWGFTSYDAGVEATDENRKGIVLLCATMTCKPTNGTVSYSISGTQITDNIACTLSDDVLAAENFGGYGLTVSFDIDKTAKTATASYQYIYYKTMDPFKVPYFMSMSEFYNDAIVVGTIGGENNDVVTFPTYYIECAGTIIFQIDNCEMVVPFNLIDSTGVGSIAKDSESAPIEYFNLQGVRVAEPASGLYIRRQGSKVSKVVVK